MKYGFVLARSSLNLPLVGRTYTDVRPNSAHSKIDPLLDEMLRNYPKVDMGKAEKTAARQ
jgi:hypothetical protein